MLAPVVTTGSRESLDMPITNSRSFIKRGKLAKLAACNIETIRYYENIGIMSQPMRTTSGHRLYSKQDQERLKFVLRCRGLGFSLTDIRYLLGMEEQPLSCEQVYVLTKNHLQTVRSKISDLKKLEATLADMSAKCERGVTPDCAVITALATS